MEWSHFCSTELNPWYDLHFQVKLTFQLPVVIGPDKNPPSSRVPPPLPPKTYPHKVSTCTVVPTSPHQPKKKRHPQLGENILQLVSSEDKSRLYSFLKNILGAVLYLTLDSQEPDESSGSSKEDIVYQFPCDLENKLFDVRGLFLTLCGIVPDVTGNNVKWYAVLLFSFLTRDASEFMPNLWLSLNWF